MTNSKVELTKSKLKIDMQCHLPSKLSKQSQSDDVTLRSLKVNSNPSTVISSKNGGHVTSNDDVTIQRSKTTVRSFNCQDQHKPEAKTELELMYNKIRVKKDKNVKIHCSQKSRKKSHKEVVDSPIRSINEVLRYNNRESPINKKSISKVKMMVEDLENPENKDFSRPKVKSLKKRLKKNEKTDVGALHNQPHISTFFCKK